MRFLPHLGTFIAGGLYALTYPSFLGSGWFPLLFLALPFFLWQIDRASSVKEGLLTVILYNLGLNLVGYYWIPATLREFGQLPFALSWVVGLFFALILQPHWYIYVLWKRWRPEFSWSSEKGVLLSAFILVLLERYFPQQFPSFAGSPWLHLAPYLGLAPYFGVALFSLMTYYVALEVVVQLKEKKLRPQVWLSLALFVVLNAVLSLKVPDSGKALAVRVVQANIGNFLKVSSENGDLDSYDEIDRRYETLSTREGFRPSLIVWPETAYPHTFNGVGSDLAPIFERITRSTGAEILIGGYDQDPSKSPFDLYESVFNSSILMSAGKVKQSYHKNILIPFGETLPFGPFNSQIVSIVPAVSLFARGLGTPKMETRDGFRFVTPICYEILESNYMRELLNTWQGNHFIVNHTNDSWYGDTAEPHQHLFLSKWRALEFNLPIIRSTNTGITSVIYPDGSESKRLGVNVEGVLDVQVPLGTGESTLYQRFGIYPLYLLFLGLFGLTWWRERN
jgi:apolipoprotein N-acyltransferase